ncbi:MAG: 2-oxo acid dehydrogenase subunit E2, partial [bacterium]
PGESAILAVATAIKKPAVKNGEVVVRSLMKMTLSADHRIVDGALAAHFVNSIKTKLEDIELWKTLT